MPLEPKQAGNITSGPEAVAMGQALERCQFADWEPQLFRCAPSAEGQAMARFDWLHLIVSLGRIPANTDKNSKRHEAQSQLAVQ